MSRRRRGLAVLVALAALAAVPGCTAAEQAVGDAATSAATRAGEAAVDEVRRQVCDPVLGGELGADDVQVLADLVPAARSAGLPPELLDPLEDVAASGDEGSADAVERLRQACAASPSPS